MHEEANTHTLIECVCVCVLVLACARRENKRCEIRNMKSYACIFIQDMPQRDYKAKVKSSRSRSRGRVATTETASINDWTKQRVKWKPPQRSWKIPKQQETRLRAGRRQYRAPSGHVVAVPEVEAEECVWFKNKVGVGIQDVPHACRTAAPWAATTANCCLKGVGATNKQRNCLCLRLCQGLRTASPMGLIYEDYVNGRDIYLNSNINT